MTRGIFDAGYLRLGHWTGTPIRLHWTAPLGALFFGRFQWAPAFWFSFLFLIAIHEIGHAVLVRRYGATPITLDIHGLGGLCRWYGSVSPIGTAMIAWGGVAAQFVALIFALAALFVFGAPTTAATFQLRSAFVEQNLFLMALNLVPVPPLDGFKAWQLFGLLWAQRNARKQQIARKHEAARKSTLQKLRRLDKAGSHLRLVKSDVDELLRKTREKGDNKDDS